jgi:hypothetical protein
MKITGNVMARRGRPARFPVWRTRPGPPTFPPAWVVRMRGGWKEEEMRGAVAGISWETAKSKPWIAVIVADNPDPDAAVTDVVKEMIWKALQITASQTARIEVKKSRIRTCLLYSDSEFGKEIIFQRV